MSADFRVRCLASRLDTAAAYGTLEALLVYTLARLEAPAGNGPWLFQSASDAHGRRIADVPYLVAAAAAFQAQARAQRLVGNRP